MNKPLIISWIIREMPAIDYSYITTHPNTTFTAEDAEPEWIKRVQDKWNLTVDQAKECINDSIERLKNL